MSGSACKSLDMFTRLCGDKAAKRVRLVTTGWDREKDKNMAEHRVKQLKKKFWKPLITAGAHHCRFDNTPESAWDIVRHAAGDSEVLLLQKELIDMDRGLHRTSAGQALSFQFQRLFQEQQETIKTLPETHQDPESTKLEADYTKIEAQTLEAEETDEPNLTAETVSICFHDYEACILPGHTAHNPSASLCLV